MGTTRYPCHRTTRRWPPVVPNRLNASELRRRLLPRSGGQGVAGSNPAVPTGSRVFSNIFTARQSQQKSHLHAKWPFQRRALIACHASHQGIYQSGRTDEARQSRGQRSLSPPRICTATLTTANRRAPSPAAPANRKPDAHRTVATAGRGQAWAWSAPGPGRRIIVSHGL